MSEEAEVHICEPEQGPILREDNDKRSYECLREWLKNAELKQKGIMQVISKETKKSQDLKLRVRV